jgi:hypothetical protein
MTTGKLNLVLLGVLLAGGASAATLVPISGLSPYPPFADPFSTDVGLVTACQGPGVIANITGSSKATVYRNSEGEPSLAVNPTDHNNIIVAYQQDRWSRSGGATGIVVAYTMNGGLTWSHTNVPSTRCGGGLPGSAGDFERDSDPWVAFSANGTAYLASLPFNIGQDFNESFAVSKSTNKGATWTSTTVSVDPTAGLANVYDGSKVVVDSVDNNTVYFTGGNYPYKGSGHDVLDPTNNNGKKSQLVFSKSTDAGVTWSPIRVVAQFPPSTQQGHFEILAIPPTTAHPQGILTGVIQVLNNVINKSPSKSSKDTIAVIQSFDRGNTWSAVKDVATIEHSTLPLDEPFETSTGLSFNNGNFVGALALDKNSGAIYASWTDSRFSGKAVNGNVIMKSDDGGTTWSQPINATPGTPVNVSSNVFKIAVAANGTVGVLSYDFRNDLPNDSTWNMDVYLSFFRPNATTHQLDYLSEQRLTPVSMDARQLLTRTTIGAGYPGLWLGDYMGLATDGNDFLVAFTRTNQNNTVPEVPVNTTVLKVDSVNHQDIVFTRVTAP